MFWVALIVVIITLGYYYYQRTYNYWKNLGINQTNPLPFFGDMFPIVSQKMALSHLVQNIYSQFPNSRYSGMYLFNSPTLVIRDPELIKQILVKDFDHFLDHKPFIDPEGDPLWSNNLFAMRGQRWKELRPKISPAFTSSKMKYMFSLMVEASKQFIQYFETQDKNLIVLEMKDSYTRFANDVIASCVFGLKVDSLNDKENYFYVTGKQLTSFTGFWKNIKIFSYNLIPLESKYLKFGLFSSEEVAFFRKIVRDTIALREREGIVRPDLIQILMNSRKENAREDINKDTIDTGFATVHEAEVGSTTKKPLTDDEIVAQAAAFFFAGFDSVSGLMCFTSYELALHQNCQDKLRAEIQETMEECNGNLTYEGLMKMKYLDMIISESLRKWPNAAVTDRLCTKPYTIQPKTPDEKPIHLKIGDSISVPLCAIQMDPQYFPDPEKFDPERFSDENKSKIVPYTFLTFGVGPRGCIGSRFAIMEVKTMLFHLLSKFKIVTTERTEIPIQIAHTGAGLNAKNGFWLGLQKI
ncbi:cytochrome P450 9e2 [Aethina tumida]|uniref:cytochrome P450 9e2 n=1 Tax=Aethina tumida TaxID=116153 RepID=UPI0021476D72|nr:cytochrome P450 9e2 [Aethina tumida]